MDVRRSVTVLALACLLAASSCTGPSPTPPLKGGPSDAGLPPGEEPRPEPAVEAMVEAMEQHAVVAIGESHNLREAGAFYASLVRDTSFFEVADVIVVEFGNSLY